MLSEAVFQYKKSLVPKKVVNNATRPLNLPRSNAIPIAGIFLPHLQLIALSQADVVEIDVPGGAPGAGGKVYLHPGGAGGCGGAAG